MPRVTRSAFAAQLAKRPVQKNADQRFVWGVAYPAQRLDGHGEFMVAPEVERTAWGFLAKGREIGFYHADGTLGHATVVESAIHRGPSYVTKDITGREQTINPGDWLIGVRFDEETWPLVKSGRVNGWSIQGAGKRRSVPRSILEN